MTDHDLTIAEVAATLRVNYMTIWRMIQRGQFPGAYRVGKSIRIPQSDVTAIRNTTALRGKGE